MTQTLFECVFSFYFFLGNLYDITELLLNIHVSIQYYDFFCFHHFYLFVSVFFRMGLIVKLYHLLVDFI